MESKIFNGESPQEEYKYIASLQLNDSHICGSSMIQKGFLLTSSQCAWCIGHGIEREMRRATAVIGNTKLKNGQRVNILKIAYFINGHSNHTIWSKNDQDVGLVMVSRLELFNSIILLIS